WLLDPQLAEYLPEGSNILAFQRLFRLVERGAPGDADVFRFVLSMPEVDPRRAPRGSRLERAAADHVAAGRHWRVRTGWLRLRRTAAPGGAGRPRSRCRPAPPPVGAVPRRGPGGRGWAGRGWGGRRGAGRRGRGRRGGGGWRRGRRAGGRWRRRWGRRPGRRGRCG